MNLFLVFTCHLIIPSLQEENVRNGAIHTVGYKSLRLLVQFNLSQIYILIAHFCVVAKLIYIEILTEVELKLNTLPFFHSGVHWM